MPAVCLLEARLEASDVGFLVREAHPRGGGLVGGGQVGVPKRRPALRGLLLCGVGVVCRVEECAEWVRCSLPSAVLQFALYVCVLWQIAATGQHHGSLDVCNDLLGEDENTH